MDEVESVQKLLIGPMSGLASGWLVAQIFRAMYRDKDAQFRQHIQATIEHLYEENKACNERVNLLLGEVLRLRSRVEEREAPNAA